MKTSRASLLLHPLFIISLAVLLLNDFYWKYTYHNWLTGKLSDIAGLLVLSLFLRDLFPNTGKKYIHLLVALIFTWWKSPLSQSLLDFFNSVLDVPMYRVVDYTDLFTLPVLLVAYVMEPKPLNLYRVAQHCLQYALACLTIFSLCATSMPYQRGLYLHSTENEVYFNESFKVNKSEAEVLQTLRNKNIAFKQDSVEYLPVANQPNLYHRTFNEKDSTVTWQQVNMDTALYIKREWSPYYFIRDYEKGDVKLWRIKFRMDPNKSNTKTTVNILSFQTANSKDVYAMDRKRRKEYKTVLEQLFR